jgi:putative monooxygenase
MGVLELGAGEAVSEHFHPYSEEFLYVVSGALRLRLERSRVIDLGPGDSVMIPPGVRHRLENGDAGDAFCVFHLSPLAPRPDLGHVDTEPLPDPTAPAPQVGGDR